MTERKVIITGAFSYTGSAVTGHLQNRNWKISTLTRRRNPSRENIDTKPLHFDKKHLLEIFRDYDVFVNTFWIRLPMMGETFETAVEKSKLLFSCAKEAGVERIVHVSVSNAEQGRNLGYYRGKFEVEEFLRDLDLPYAIIRPTLIVGPEDVLTNNIAWFLRRFPIFFLPRGGIYRLQPITLNDVGKIIADTVEDQKIIELDAAGPDIFTFKEYLLLLQRACGVNRPMLSVPNWLALYGIKTVEYFLRDCVLVKEELLGLEQELLLSKEPGIGKESVGDWLMANGIALGKTYVNDIKRHFTDGVSIPVLNINSH